MCCSENMASMLFETFNSKVSFLVEQLSAAKCQSNQVYYKPFVFFIYI